MASRPAASDLAPDALLRLAAHPLRWRLLQDLASSDRTVQELTARVGEPQNLVSYHLAQLRKGRLVRTRRSSADRRDSWYGLDFGHVGKALAGAGGALHPALRYVPAPTRLSGEGRSRVLFLCTGNSARSPMAAALAAARSGGLVEAVSAGSRPRPVHPMAVQVLRDTHQLDISGHVPTRISDVMDGPFDRVITLCDRVKEVCPDFPGHPRVAHWSLANPAEAEGEALSAFRETVDELALRTDILLADLAGQSSTTETPGGPNAGSQ